MGKKNDNKLKKKKTENKDMSNMEIGQEVNGENKNNKNVEKQENINFAKNKR